MAHVQVQTPSGGLRAKRMLPKFEDSPSRQLILDLERALCQVHIHGAELQKVHSYDQHLFQENLDILDMRKAQEDVAALDAATSRHETVRQEAEAELIRYYREVEEQERLKRQEEERRLLEQQARTKAEAEKKLKDEADRKERIAREQTAARKAAEDRARNEEVERRRQEEDLAQEKAEKEKAEKERKKREEQRKAKALQQAAEEKAAQESAAQTATVAEQRIQPHGRSITHTNPEMEGQHGRYLQVHQNLKRFRKEFWAQCKKDASLKAKVGDMRRAIKTSVGQLTEARGANRQPTERIKSTLKNAVTIPSPPVDMRDYFAVVPSEFQTLEQSQCPSLLVYVLNIFAKAIVTQFGGESGISIKAAEPAGVLVAQIFAATEYQFKGHSLIDILLAKLHFACPVLWGVYGDETTPEGRVRLGWRREDGAFVSESRHHERVSGLGAGFASIALRNFTKSRLRNPFPPTNFWEGLANILNVPPGDVQPTHLFVLKAMLENSVERFLQFYGSAAVAALGQALIKFPATLDAKLQDTAACKAINLLVDMLAREKNFTIG